MGNERGSGEHPGYLTRFTRRARELDRHGGAVRTAHALRQYVPGSDNIAGPALAGVRTSDRLARLIGQVTTEQPSLTRELGLAAVQLWQAASGSGHVRNTDVTIVFTDLVEFSEWALHAGDDHVLRLLREVGRASDEVITRHGGRVVKSLGDGLMAVFDDTTAAVEAAHEACTAVSAIRLDGYRPQLRVGMHRGQPRRVREDYLGVDVNIASRVAGAASGGEVLVSGPASVELDTAHHTLRRRRRFAAKGTPKDLNVYSVVPRYTQSDQRKT